MHGIPTDHFLEVESKKYFQSGHPLFPPGPKAFSGAQAGNRKDSIHFDEGCAELPIIFRYKNIRKFWTKFGLEGDYIHALRLSLLW